MTSEISMYGLSASILSKTATDVSEGCYYFGNACKRA